LVTATSDSWAATETAMARNRKSERLILRKI
jgi:hypothetical protein